MEPRKLTEQEQEQLRQLHRDLEKLPPGHKLTFAEWLEYAKRMPQLVPDGWTSADDIRELRGPLPEDDPEYQRNYGRR